MHTHDPCIKRTARLVDGILIYTRREEQENGKATAELSIIGSLRLARDFGAKKRERETSEREERGNLRANDKTRQRARASEDSLFAGDKTYTPAGKERGRERESTRALTVYTSHGLHTRARAPRFFRLTLALAMQFRTCA